MTDALDRLNEALRDRYAVARELGEGGMATVYLAEDIRHERKVALKVLKPALAAVVGGERFLAEIKTTANLQHPHILPLYDSGEADGFLFYVMPYVEGVSLRERIDREQQLPVDEAVRIATAVSHALDYAHRQGVIHRDVKPANILLQDGEPVVADFGIALAVQEAGGGRLTETGLSLGTPYYMSPEQATAERDPGPASDVYSLACVVYEMLTGDPPFTGRSAQAVVARILTDDPRPPSELRSTVPPHVDAALLRALRKVPADRFGTAAAFAEALNDPTFALSDTSAGAITAASGRGLWNSLTVATTALAVALLAFTIWGALNPEPAAPVRWYGLALPESQALDPSEVRPRIALSPDGSRLVYVGPGSRGVPTLWVRARDRLGATPLPATEGAALPFVSPDGTRIGFLRRPVAGGAQALVVASPTGGPPEVLVDDQVGLDGAAWGTDGHIYYDGITGGGTRGIMRVAEGGGTPEQMTVVDTARGETDHVWPQVLPDGRGLLFTVLRGSELDRADVALLDFETGERRLLVRAVTARYAEPGYLVFVRADGTLAAVAVEDGSLEPTGEAEELAEGVSVRQNGAVGLAGPEAGTLVYVTGPGAPEPAQLTWIDRSGGREPVQSGWYEDFRTVALSPDGSRLAVSIAVGGWSGIQDIHIKELPSGPLSRLTVTEQVLNYRPEWVPGGRAVTFVSNRGGELALYQRPADGTAASELVLDHPDPITDVTYTGDGEWLVFARAADLYALRTDGTADPVPLVSGPAQEGEPAVSPDGRWLAYTSDESGSPQVYVAPFPETRASRHTVSTGGGFSPRWAHRGGELFYKTPTGELVSVELAPGESFEVSRRSVLFTVPSLYGWASVDRYAVAPDDERFLVVEQRGGQNAEVVVVENFPRVLEERVSR